MAGIFRRRLPQIGLTLLLVGACGGAAVWAKASYDGYVVERDAKTTLLETLKRSTPQKLPPGLEADIDRRDPYLPGESETIAAANLQTRIRGLVQQAGGTVFSTQVQPRTEGDQPERRIDVQVVFESTIEVLQSALFTIETGAPFGFVNDLAVAPVRAGGGSAPVGEGEAEAAPRTLRSTLTVSSYWRRPTP